MALTAVDRALLHRCLHHDPGAWNDFVDRFLGLIYHVIHHTAYLRSTPLPAEDIEDVGAEILLQIVANDYAILRQFRYQSSLATYLTVIARRICVHEMARRAAAREVQPKIDGHVEEGEETHKVEHGLERLEEVQKLLNKLPSREREVVRMMAGGYSNREIGGALGVAERTVKNHVSSILAKLGVRDRTRAVLKALEKRLF